MRLSSGKLYVAQRAAHGLRALVQDHLGDLDGVLGEAVHVDRTRHQQRFLDLLRRHLLGVDYEVDPEHLTGEWLSCLEVVGVVYTRHGAGDSLGLRSQASDDIHFVGVTRRNEQVGAPDAGFIEQLGVGAVTGDHQRVELLGGLFHELVVLLDEHDVVAFVREHTGRVEPDLPCSYDHRVQSGKPPANRRAGRVGICPGPSWILRPRARPPPAIRCRPGAGSLARPSA